MYHGVKLKVHDMAENKNTDDLLGYADYAHTLWARILAALNSDAANAKLGKDQKLLGDDPLVVGIFGEWGAGKSRLLQLIHRKAEEAAVERFAAHMRDPGMDLTVPVFFQPWKYEHEPHLLVPLLMHILAELNKSLELSKGLEEKVKQQFDAVGDKLVQAMPRLVSSVGNLVKSVAAKFATVDPTGTAAGLAIAGVLANYIANEKKPIRKNAKELSFEDNGRSYYEIHEILKHITRPQKHKYTHPNYKIDQDIRINFVIFIDDLDRCLPEKAVETLELIKTIFNAESFAFVLALDEEIIERGIGHRYKDYTLVGKKPEMPITGFEYLEKIVHLPFRLPALTQAQAFNFLACYEEKLIAQRAPYSKKRECWFQPKILSIPSSVKEFASKEYITRQTTDDFSGWGDEKLEKNIDSRNLSLRQITQAESITLNLAGLVIGSFNAFVPRKLIRVVELFHQVLDVLDKRNTSHMFTVGGEPKKTIDPRIAMANILLQLFQPELQRTLRRSKTGFDVLLQAFAPQTTSGNMQLSSSKSDADLLHWAIYLSGDKRPPMTLRSATLRLADMTDEGQRYSSQRLLLVIVERLLEHRSIQRHAFDPLKLFETLQATTRNGSIALPDETRWMSAMLSATTDTMGDSVDTILPVLTINHQVEIVDSGIVSDQAQSTDAIGHVINPEKVQKIFSVSNIDAVFLSLISPEEPEQRRIAEIAGLHDDEVLSRDNIEFLVSACKDRYFNGKIPFQNSEWTYDSGRSIRLLRGLKYLAPHIASADGQVMWDLVKNSVDHLTPVMHQLRAQWHDVRAALGQDPRFEGKYSLTKRVSTDAAEAPAGFVKILAGTYAIGSKNEEDNTEKNVKLKQRFYISRYLVTVAQYAAFRQSEEFKDWSDARTEEIHEEVHEWLDQLGYQNRPVVSVNWFEATAYAQWLQSRLVAGDLGAINVPKGYELRLPTEIEWEIAARGSLKRKNYPWGDEVYDIERYANLDSLIGHATTVGSYDANDFGLFDMAGNVWEWQRNFSSIGEPYRALRGGSWAVRPGFARCSFRNWNSPDDGNNDIGFRLVLSLVDL